MRQVGRKREKSASHKVKKFESQKSLRLEKSEKLL